MANHGRRLGRGLGALFPSLPEEQSNVTENNDAQSKVPAPGITAQMTGNISRETDNAKQHASEVTDRDNSENTKSMGEAERNAHAQHDISRETKEKSVEHKSSRKRPTMPSLADSVHPSNMFFGEQSDQGTSRPSVSSQAANSVFGEISPRVQTDNGPVNEPVAAQNGDVSRETSSDDGTEAVVKEPLQDVNGGYLTELNIHDIIPNAKQPRTIFDEDDLDELSRSIAEVGILQPIVVRPRNAHEIGGIVQKHGDVAGGNAEDTNVDAQNTAHYELIMGERRWRASQRAGLETIPAIVRTTSDSEMLREALLENLQRVALNPLEEAAAYQQMLNEFGITQAQLSKSVSKSRPQIANTLRLLQLPAGVQKRVASGVLSAGHARALLSLGDEEQMEALANRIIAEGLSVRTTEEIVSMHSTKKKGDAKRTSTKNIWTGTETLQRLENHFNTKVTIRGTKKRGKIEINFASEEDFQRILDLLNAQQVDANEWK